MLRNKRQIPTLVESIETLRSTTKAGSKTGRPDYMVTALSFADTMNIYNELERLQNFEKAMKAAIQNVEVA